MITRWIGLVFGLGMSVGSVGCSAGGKARELSISPVRSMVIAVAPAINLSGSKEIDPVKLGDLMASELGQIDGVDVIGVNRVLAALNPKDRGTWDGSARVTQIRDPAEAVRIADQLGADGILVFAVTEYDAYDPPTVGIGAQVYSGSGTSRRVDGSAGHGASDSTQVEDVAEEMLVPRAQVQRVFRSSREDVLKEVEAYGKDRDARKSAYGWRRYVVSQEDYFRYCCHAVLRDLMRSECCPVFVRANGPKDEEGMP